MVSSLYHMFDLDVAKQVGLVAAVIFQNMAFWCQHSQVNGTNYHDGNFWTYNTVKALKAVFPYLSASQIDTGIKKLVDAGFIIKGNYNKSAYDRTTWYAITKFGKSIFEKSKMENGEIENGFPENRKPIPYINTDVNADINNNTSLSRSRAVNMIPQNFKRFWEAYPRKVNRQTAEKTWAKLNPDDELLEKIIQDINRRLEKEWRGKDMQYIPHASTYLNQRRWEDETEVGKVATDRRPDEDVVIDAEQERLIDEIYKKQGRDAWM